MTSRELPLRRFDLSCAFEPKAEEATLVGLTAQVDLQSMPLERPIAAILMHVVAQVIGAFEAADRTPTEKAVKLGVRTEGRLH